MIEKYQALKAAFSNGQYDACGLRAGVFCEVILRFLQEHLTGSHIPFGAKIQNFDQECERLEKTPHSAGPESLRVLMPRALAFLFSLRNKRGIGHIGGDIDANEIDASTMVKLTDWCLCELLRIFHKLPLEQAQGVLDAITERQLPHVWSVVGKKRILDSTLDYRSQTLLLLYTEVESAIPIEDLFQWTEHSNLSNYRRDVLRPLHSQRFIEHDRDTETAIISPKGINRLEAEILVRGQVRESPNRTPGRTKVKRH